MSKDKQANVKAISGGGKAPPIGSDPVLGGANDPSTTFVETISMNEPSESRNCLSVDML